MLDVNEPALLAIAEVKTAYFLGAAKIGITSLTMERFLMSLGGPMGIAAVALTDWGKTEYAVAISTDYKKLGELVDLWATRDLQRAIDSDPKLFGGVYTWDDWRERGDDLLAAIQDDTGLAYDNMPFHNYVATAKGIAADTAQLAVDVAGAARAAGDAAKDALDWLPWVVGGIAATVGGFLLYEVIKSTRTAGDEMRLTVRAAGGAARRRFEAGR